MRIHVAVMGKYIKTLVYLEVSFPNSEEMHAYPIRITVTLYNIGPLANTQTIVPFPLSILSIRIISLL